MAPMVIDLTSSPEPDESPAKAAKSVLQDFKPRSQKTSTTQPVKYGQQSTLDLGYAGSSTYSSLAYNQEMPHGLPLPKENQGTLHGKPKPAAQLQSPLEIALSRLNRPALELGSRHAHPTPGQNLPSAAKSRPTELANGKQAHHSSFPKAKISMEVINIEDDSDASSSRDDSDTDINGILQAELDGVRPAKRRRLDAPHERSQRQPFSTEISSTATDHVANRVPGGQSISQEPLSTSNNATARPVMRDLPVPRQMAESGPIPSTQVRASPASTVKQQDHVNQNQVIKSPGPAGVAGEAQHRNVLSSGVDLSSHSPNQLDMPREPQPGFKPNEVATSSGTYSREVSVQPAPVGGVHDSGQNRGIPYSKEDDELLLRYRDVDRLDWKDILPHFPGRNTGSLAGHYGQLKVKSKGLRETPATETQPSGHGGNHGVPYSAEEDALLKKLKEADDLTWDEIVPRFSGRTRGSLQVRYSSKLKSIGTTQQLNLEVQMPAVDPNRTSRPETNYRVTYSPKEDARIVRLKGEGLTWDQMAAHFSGRTAGSLAVRYSTKLKGRPIEQSHSDDDVLKQPPTDEESTSKPQRQRRRHNGPSVLSGFISWADIKKVGENILEEDEELEPKDKASLQDQTHQHLSSNVPRRQPRTLARTLRQREIGSNCGRSATISTRSVPDKLKHHVFDDIGPRKFYQGTSGDVTCVAWAQDGKNFAAGSIAITDERNMQYNKPYNLLLGRACESVLRELPDHYIERPLNADMANVNSLQSMRETQDRRLFMTVSSVQFSPDGHTLFSAGTDRKVRAYDSSNVESKVSCQYELDHPAPVYLLSVSNQAVLATASHQATNDSIRVYRERNQVASLAPKRADSQIERPIFPSALKWGISSHHSNLLLAGFSIDSVDEERNLAGETCLWDMHRGMRIEINAVTRNVFDVAWNPSPSTGSTAFAVACTPGPNKVNRGTRSVVQCFAPKQDRAAAVLEFESRAFDINDVVYCPHDNNLIAAGATDGKVYIWDQRYAKQGSGPLHTLCHGQSLNVLDHDRKPELADTGIRFLQWGATSSRLYSGSSDGTVKVWNPYMSMSNAHIRDVATFTSAVMSGAFSPDYCDILIGEDQGRINLLSIGHGDRGIRSMERFNLNPAPAPENGVASNGRQIANTLLATGEIELRSMGALPIRQALQGPKYAGPFATSASDIQKAENDYQNASDLQSEVHLKAVAEHTHNSEHEKSLQDADDGVNAAQKAMLLLQERFDNAEVLRRKAGELQSSFRKAEKKHVQLESSLSYELKRCTLDCDYLPMNADEDGGVSDSRRSERRIPSELWAVQDTESAHMDSGELKAAGLTEKCVTCRKSAPKPKVGLPLCPTCTRQKSGFTATCEICSAPIRPVFERHGVNLCERCNFACFRCGAPAQVAQSGENISCYKCELSWTAGVLGYELRRDL